jgi:hypothetical protein
MKARDAQGVFDNWGILDMVLAVGWRYGNQSKVPGCWRTATRSKVELRRVDRLTRARTATRVIFDNLN